MPKRFRWLLLDANVVIEAFELGLWEKLVELCEIHLARTVVEIEALYYEDQRGEQQVIRLDGYLQTGSIHVFEVGIDRLEDFRQRFGPFFLEQLDPGETESLAFLFDETPEWPKDPASPWRICSSDKIVHRVLGSVGRGDQWIPLEETLQRLGLSRSVPEQFTAAFRKRWTEEGFREGLWGLGPRSGP